MTGPLQTDGGVSGDPDADPTEIEDLVRKAIRRTYPSEQLEQAVEYVDVHHEQYDEDAHLLRARAPDHELLGFERWLVVTVEGRNVHIRGAGRASPTEFYVRAKLDEG